MRKESSVLYSLERISSLFDYLIWDTCALVGCLGSDINEINFIDLMKKHLGEGGRSYLTRNVIREYLSINYWEEKLIPLIGKQRTDGIMTKRNDLVEVFREKERVLELREKEEKTSARIINLAPNFRAKYGISATDFEVLIYDFVIGFERGSVAIVSNDSRLSKSFNELGKIFEDNSKSVAIIARKEEDGFDVLNVYN